VIEFDAKQINWEKGKIKLNGLLSHRLGGRGLRGGRLERRMKRMEGVEDHASAAPGDHSQPAFAWDPLHVVDALDGWDDEDEDKPDDISGIFSLDEPAQGQPLKEATGIVTRPPFTPITKCWTKFHKVVKYDKEAKRIMKLAGPFVTQALVSGVAEAARLSIVAHYYGARALSAYVVPIMMIHLTTAFFGSVNDAVRLLTSMSIGMGNTKLTGKYTQVGLILSALTILPTCFFWIAVIGPVLDWFGFDEETVALGKAFTRTYVWSQILERMDCSLQTLLDTVSTIKWLYVFF
jgi:MatE